MATRNVGTYAPPGDFDEKATTLTVHTPHYRPGDIYKCASAVDAVTYHWDGRALSQTAIQTELLKKEKPKATPPRPIPVHVP